MSLNMKTKEFALSLNLLRDGLALNNLRSMIRQETKQKPFEEYEKKDTKWII